jgi:hypothetical protein
VKSLQNFVCVQAALRFCSFQRLKNHQAPFGKKAANFDMLIKLTLDVVQVVNFNIKNLVPNTKSKFN